jgi:hypothetical protein
MIGAVSLGIRSSEAGVRTGGELGTEFAHLGEQQAETLRHTRRGYADSENYCKALGSEDRLCDLYVALPTNITLVVRTNAERRRVISAADSSTTQHNGGKKHHFMNLCICRATYLSQSA